MINNFKKIVITLFILVLSLSLFACKKDDNNGEKNEDNKNYITVEYNTNGGSAIEKQELTLENIVSYKLPNDPTKEGYYFIGWYLDTDFNTPYKGLTDLTKSITLYAKWAKKDDVVLPPEPVLSGDGLDISFNFKFDVKSKSYEFDYSYNEETGEYDVTAKEVNDGGILSLTINMLAPKTKVNTLSEFSSKFDIDLKLDQEQVFKGTIYVFNGYVYLTIPAGVANLKIKVGINEVLSALEAIAKDAVAGIDNNVSNEGTSITEYLGLLTKYINELELSQETLESLIDAFKELLPKMSKEEKTFVYTLTQDQFVSFLDKLVEVVTKNSEEINNAIEKLLAKINEIISNLPGDDDEDVEDNTYVDYEGNTFTKGVFGYTDSDGVFHSLKENNAYENYGYYDEEYGTYYLYCLCEHFDFETGKALTEQEYLDRIRSKEYCNYDGTIFTYNQNKYVDAAGVEHSIKEDFENENYGFVDEKVNVYFLYCFSQAFDINTLEPLTDEEYEKRYKELYESDNPELDITSVLGMIVERLKASININDIKVLYKTNQNGEPEELLLVFDVKVQQENDGYTSTSCIALNTGLKVNSFSATVDTSILDNTYLDYTFMIIEAINNLVSNELK